MTEFNIPYDSLKDLITRVDKVAYLLESRYHDALIAEMHLLTREIVNTLFYADACHIIRDIKNRQRIVYNRYHDELTQEIVECAAAIIDLVYTTY